MPIGLIPQHEKTAKIVGELAYLSVMLTPVGAVDDGKTLVTGKGLDGEDSSRLLALLGIATLGDGSAIAKVVEKTGGLVKLARTSVEGTPEAARLIQDLEAAGKGIAGSPVDIAHAVGADYTKAGKPTGGHSLVNGDVQIVPGTESVPDATGVYKATVQVKDPQNPGQWITKTSNSSTNSMFPKDWDAARIQSEVDAAWNSSNKVVNGNKWSSFTPSGVKVEGFISPRTTVYPVYQSPK